MKYISLALASLFMSGCVTTSVPVTYSLPQMPEVLAEPCPPLKTIEGSTTTLSVLLQTVATNYSLYHECAAKVRATADWYKVQREILESSQIAK
jgi:hypothetical protein